MIKVSEPCFCRAVEKSGTFHTPHENEIVEILSQNIARTGRIHNSTNDMCYLKNNYLLELTSLYILNLPLNRKMKRRT